MNKEQNLKIGQKSNFTLKYFHKGLGVFLIIISQNIVNPEIGKSQKINYSDNFGERLVSLALANNPDNRAVINKAQVSAYILKEKKISILNNLIFNFNLNEYSFVSKSISNTFYIPKYPKYNISLTLPLGIFFTLPKEISRASKQYDYSADLVYTERENLRNRVLDTYQLFLSNRELLNISSKNFQESRITFLNSEKDFNKGISSFNDYSRAKSNFITGMVQNLKSKHDYFVSKNDLERLIGVKLEDLQSN